MSSRKCSVIGCSSVKRNPKISFFSVPKHNSPAWNSIINNVNCKVTNVRFVCAEHFLPEDIVTTYSGHAQDIAQEIGNRLKCGLKKGAVPSVFNCIKDRVLRIETKPNSYSSDHNYAKYYTTEPRCRTNFLEKVNCKLEYKEIEEPAINYLSFSDLIINFKRIILPSGWLTHYSDDEIAFYKPNFSDSKMHIERQLIFKSTSEIQLYIYQFHIPIENINIKLEYPICSNDISQAIDIIHYKTICPGGPNSIDFPGVRVKTAILESNKFWRHRKCKIMIDLKKRCKSCNHLISYFRNCKHRAQVKQLSYNPNKCRTLKTNLKENNN